MEGHASIAASFSISSPARRRREPAWLQQRADCVCDAVLGGDDLELEAVALGYRRVRGAGAGIGYVAGCPIDDRPFDIRSKHGTLASIPYEVEADD